MTAPAAQCLPCTFVADLRHLLTGRVTGSALSTEAWQRADTIAVFELTDRSAGPGQPSGHFWLQIVCNPAPSLHLRLRSSHSSRDDRRLLLALRRRLQRLPGSLDVPTVTVALVAESLLRQFRSVEG